jgi:pyruvate dehydrogenase E1 component
MLTTASRAADPLASPATPKTDPSACGHSSGRYRAEPPPSGVPAASPSFTQLRREGLATERWNMLHPTEPPRRSYVETCMADRPGPVIAATDYIKSFADQIRPFVPRRYRVLGTDGFGRSDYRRNLRRFFEVDRHYVAVAALASLAEDGTVPAATVVDAISRYAIDADKPDPSKV